MQHVFISTTHPSLHSSEIHMLFPCLTTLCSFLPPRVTYVAQIFLDMSSPTEYG